MNIQINVNRNTGSLMVSAKPVRGNNLFIFKTANYEERGSYLVRAGACSGGTLFKVDTKLLVIFKYEE